MPTPPPFAKRWTYAGIYGRELMLCAARVEIGPARQAFWAIWDRSARRLHDRTRFLGLRRVRVTAGRLWVADGDVEIDLALAPAGAPWSARCPAGRDSTWTRKTPLRAVGTVRVGRQRRSLRAGGILDESAGRHARHTAWRWSAGVGRTPAGATVTWNLVAGLNDPPQSSERAIWVDGTPTEAPPADFAADLTAVRFPAGEALRFAAEARRARRDELLVVASDYEQPFGTFAGTLPGGHELAEGFGVMERHAARW